MKTNFATVYESIGYLFYAISKNGKSLSQEEFTKLDEVIGQKWQPILDCSHRYHLNSAETVQLDLINHLHAAIRKAYECHMSKDAAFEHFKDYYVHHSLPFNETIRESVLATCKSIKEIFSGNDDPANRNDRMYEVRQLLGQQPVPPSSEMSHINL